MLINRGHFLKSETCGEDREITWELVTRGESELTIEFTDETRQVDGLVALTLTNPTVSDIELGILSSYDSGNYYSL